MSYINPRRIIAEERESAFFNPLIKTIFCNSNFKKLDTYNFFDFYNDELKVYIEVKSFNSRFLQYPEVLLGYDKIDEGIKHISKNYNVFFIIEFEGGIIKILELTKDVVKNSSIKIFNNKKHILIPTRFFETLDDTDRYYFI
jgi:hypothetical protein